MKKVKIIKRILFVVVMVLGVVFEIKGFMIWFNGNDISALICFALAFLCAISVACCMKPSKSDVDEFYR